MTTTTTTPDGTLSTPTGTRTRSSIRALAVGAAIGSGLAIVTNLAVFIVGNMGAPLQVTSGGEPKVVDLDLASVLIASIAWIVIGAVGLGVARRLFRQGFAVWAIGAGIVTAASLIPVLALDVDAGSKVALTVMHVVVALAAVSGQVIAQRRTA